MSNVAFPEEAPTRPAPRIGEPLLVFASRVDRLAELALERLQCAPDGESLEAAVADLTQLRELAAGVLR
jgi:hypothetical protein